MSGMIKENALVKIKILKNYEPKIYFKNESLTDLYEISNDFMKKIYLI